LKSLIKKILSNTFILIFVLQVSVFAVSSEQTPFFESAAVTSGGFGVAYAKDLDLYVAYGRKGSSALYTSVDGLNWMPAMTDFNRSIMAFAYGDGKALALTFTTNSPVTEDISKNANCIYIFDKNLESYSNTITVEDRAKTTDDYLLIKGTIIWDEYTGKFWAGGCRFNEKSSPLRSHFGLYYTDGNTTTQIYDSNGNVVTKETENTKKRTVMKWTAAMDLDDPYGTGEIDTLYPVYKTDGNGDVVFDENGNKVIRDYIDETEAAHKFMNGHVISWIKSNGKGHIIAGTGFSSNSYYPRNQMLMVDASKEDYRYSIVKIGEIKTAAVDKYDNVILSVTKNGGSESNTDTSGVYVTPWKELFNNTSSLKKMVIKADGDYKSSQYEVVEEILILDDMVLCFPMIPGTVDETGALKEFNGDIKVITYSEDGKLNNKYINLFNHGKTGYNASALYEFLSGSWMNMAVANKDGRVVTITGKPLNRSYSFAANNKASKMLVFDTKNLDIDSSDISDEVERADLAQVIYCTDLMDIMVNGVELDASFNQEFNVLPGDKILAGYYEFIPENKLMTVIAVYKDGVLVDAAESSRRGYPEAEKVFAGIPEGCKAKIYLWNTESLEPYKK